MIWYFTICGSATFTGNISKIYIHKISINNVSQILRSCKILMNVLLKRNFHLVLQTLIPNSKTPRYHFPSSQQQLRHYHTVEFCCHFHFLTKFCSLPLQFSAFHFFVTQQDYLMMLTLTFLFFRPGIIFMNSFSLENSNSSTIIHKIFETNSSFHVKQRTTGKVYFLFFKRFLLVSTKFSFWQADWAVGYHSMIQIDSCDPYDQTCFVYVT